MKKLLLTIALTACIMPGFAQQIEGIGPLKIGMNEGEVVKNFTELFGEPTTEKVHSDYRPGSDFARLVHNVEKPYENFEAPESDSVHVYFVQGWEVANVEIKNLKFTCIGDSVVAIHCDLTTSLREALKAKYGDGDLKDTEGTCKCSFKGSTIEHTMPETKFTTTFRDDPRIRAYTVLLKYFGYDCKASFISYCAISSKQGESAVMKANAAARKQRKIDSDNAKKDKYKEF